MKESEGQWGGFTEPDVGLASTRSYRIKQASIMSQEYIIFGRLDNMLKDDIIDIIRWHEILDEI